MRNVLLAVALAVVGVFSTSRSFAQSQLRGPRSPEVSADHKVTFRLQAPNAKSVQLLGDFTPKTLELTKDDKGVWSYTSDPLKPGSYQYWFVMDGATTPDPMN